MSNSINWILDSGASLHYYNDESQMRSYMPCRVDIKISKGTITTVGKGQALMTIVTSDGKHTRVSLTDIYFVPQIAACLISTEKLRSKGLFYWNEDNILYKRTLGSDDISVLAQVYLYRGLLWVRSLSTPTTLFEIELAALLSSRIRYDSKANADIWHLRFGYIKEHTLQQVKDQVEGIVITGDHKLSYTYEVYIQAAAKRQTSRVPIERPQH
jgi:hypothetical protein